MRRYTQSLTDIIESLSAVETTWMDEHSAAVMDVFSRLPQKASFREEDLAALFEGSFDVGITAVRLLLELSKDEFDILLKSALQPGGTGSTRFKRDRSAFLAALARLGVPDKLSKLVTTPVRWQDLILERLKFGRGSAIKGQKRGRALEDFTEAIVKALFGSRYETRCRFVGATGMSTEKADFAIPNKGEPRILIEAKGYGATGSKQTDVLGDVERIVNQKRPDTHFLLVTDGVTWRSRQGDLAKLVRWQNQGKIARIYTQNMAQDLEEDLKQLRSEHMLD